MRKFECLGMAMVLAMGGVGCASADFDSEPIEATSEASICGGPNWSNSQFHDVEAFSATGGVSKAFVDAHERAVGRMGTSCTGTLLGDGLLLTAWSCHPQPGTIFTFGDQTSPSGVQRATENFTVSEVLEEGSDDPDDYALVRLRVQRNSNPAAFKLNRLHRPRSQCGSQGFDPPRLHNLGSRRSPGFVIRARLLEA